MKDNDLVIKTNEVIMEPTIVGENHITAAEQVKSEFGPLTDEQRENALRRAEELMGKVGLHNVVTI